jgi:flagellar hook-associated protein 2
MATTATTASTATIPTTTSTNPATPTITSLGVGSGLQLQSMLDQLRAADAAPDTVKQTSITNYKAQLAEFTVVDNKLLALKSDALNLSLPSTFLARTVTSSSEGTVTATVADGTTPASSAVTVTNLAQKSSWMSTIGVASADASVYVPTSQESSGVTNPATDSIASGPGQLTITFGGSSSITVNVDSSTVLDDGGASGTSLVDLINNAPENAGKVTASTYSAGGKTYLQIAATSGGSGEANRVAITTNNTSLTFAPPNKTMTLQVGTDPKNAISLSIAADTTLSELADQINSATGNPGITASTINDGVDPNNPYKLVLTANSSGEANRISIDSSTSSSSGLPDLAMKEQAGQATANSLNAQFTVDGISYQRQSNTVSDALYGVTLNLNGTGSSTVAVANDTKGLHDMITSLVTDYNAAVQEVKTNSAYDTTTTPATAGVLSGTTLTDLPYDLEGLMTSTNTADPSGKIKSLFDLGLTFNEDGTITIDDTALTNAISTQPDGVSAFFMGDSSKNITGLADQINNRLRTMTSDTGIITGEQNAAQARIDELNQEITDDTARLDKKYAMLTSQFVSLDTYMSQQSSLSSYLTGQFNSLSSGWSGTGTSSSSSSS